VIPQFWGGGIVSRFESILISALLLVSPACSFAAPTQAGVAQFTASGASLTLPAGTKVELLVTRPVWAATAKAGDVLYAQTSFPVIAGNGIAIPPGTYVEGTIESVTRPTRRTSRAEVVVLFTKIIFANGYVVSLPGDPDTASAAPDSTPQAGSQAALDETRIAITIQATTANDLLLDNGAGVEMTLGATLALDAQQIAEAAPISRAPDPVQMKSASQCTPTPGTVGTPGTPPTVIPGTPATPSTTIPGGPGMPDITIPGSPGTPDTVIPGTPGTPGFPGRACPPKPFVISCAPAAKPQPTPAAQPAAAR
jgi:hypothetical protein